MATPRRISLCQLPTPLHRLDRLSDDLGIDLWIKRDDLTGFAGGGNKGRKLEFLMADALASEADVVVTNGSLQSNFIRQLGAACSMFGIACAAAVMHMPFEDQFGKPDGPALSAFGGNVLLDRLYGVHLHVFPDAPWETLFAHAEDVAKEYEGQGKRVYRIPIGGSSPLGAYGFRLAAEEIGFPDFVLTCSSSGSTQAGLAHAFHGTKSQVIGIAVDPEEDLYDDMRGLCQGLDDLLEEPKHLARNDFDLRFDWVGPGYGVASHEGIQAIRLMAQREGILLDPVYSGKAFAALLDLARAKAIRGKVVFWHTGGVPSLFASESFLV
jgi:D-cysteine desulfhydrase family pyridoxal phosphate-dependent enzyme